MPQSDRRDIPTFLGIGPGKSGTTWLYQFLRAHPEVFVPVTKETCYFTDDYWRGPEWYAHFFRGAARYRASGEISNTYIFDPEAPARIKAHNSNIQIISSLRNPIDRALSHYLWLLRDGETHGSFEEALEERPDLISRGLYSRHLDPFLRCFPRGQILLLVFEDLKSDSESFGRSVLTFLGVDAAFVPEGAGGTVLGAMAPRNRFLARVAKRSAVWLRSRGYPGLLTRIKDSPVTRLLYRPLERSSYPVMLPETRVRLRRYFREDVARLSDLMGRDLGALWLAEK